MHEVSGASLSLCAVSPDTLALGLELPTAISAVYGLAAVHTNAAFTMQDITPAAET